MAASSVDHQRVSVAVVGICSARHVERCLQALEHQQGAPPFDVVVAYDPHMQGVDEIAKRFPKVRFVSNAGQRNPLELASRALKEASGEVLLLTEDHCIARPDWVKTLVKAHETPGRSVIGGVVEIADGATATDWAFYFVDFFRYARPAPRGGSPTLTVCNVSYKKEQLAAIRDVWDVYFHETAINDALRTKFGELVLEPDAEVTMGRHVEFGHAVYERYAFGRLFGCTRLLFVPGKRLFYCLFAPALPLMLLGRMAQKAFRSPRLTRDFLRSLFPLTTMVLWWSWGEWLGYVTKKHPKSLIVAPEIRAAQRADASS
ncbi:MAG: glycosyltransferase [Planctomycetes bacterium]|nr:glycosyltransferase [Planctomycetota bacterium]